MLRRTTKKVRIVFGAILLSIVGYTFFYNYNQPETVPNSNEYIKDISFFKTHTNKNAVFMISWNKDLNKDLAAKKENFSVEQVVPDGKNWKTPEKPKKCSITFIQYVYSPWLDTEEKRKKAGAIIGSPKVTQFFVDIEPKEEVNDYFKITAKNLESNSTKEDFGVIKITDFNKFIKL